MSPLGLYLILKLDYIQGLFQAAMIISIITVSLFSVFKTILWLFCNSERWESDKEGMKICRSIKMKYIILGIIIAFSFSLVFCLIPSTKEAAIIYTLPAIANNTDVQQIGDNGLQILKELSVNYLNDLKAENIKPTEQK